MPMKHSEFEALTGALYPDVYRYAVWLCRDRALAEELIQESFLRAWRALPGLRNERAVKTWLISILRREYVRSFERRALERVDIELDDLAADDTADPVEVLALRRALMQISDDYREPLLLQVLMGYRCEEIAELLQTSPGAVMTRLSRARQRLRELLGEDAGRPEQREGDHQ